jgi:hypothetical protein
LGFDVTAMSNPGAVSGSGPPSTSSTAARSRDRLAFFTKSVPALGDGRGGGGPTVLLDADDDDGPEDGGGGGGSKSLGGRGGGLAAGLPPPTPRPASYSVRSAGSIRIRYASVRSAAIPEAISWNSRPRC